MNGIKNSEQNILNTSFDEDFNMLAVENMIYNPSTNTLERMSYPTILYGTISQSGAGTTELVTAQSGLKITVVSYVFTMLLAGTVKFIGDTDLTGSMDIPAGGGAAVLGQIFSPLFQTLPSKALSITTTGGAAKGHFSYCII